MENKFSKYSEEISKAINSSDRVQNSREGTSSTSKERNAIVVNKKLLDVLRKKLSKELGQFDFLPDNSNLLSAIVREMFDTVQGVYSRLVPPPEHQYKWYGTDVVAEIQSMDDIRDKGRFVDACMIAYLFGSEGISRYCQASRVMYPASLPQEGKAAIAKVVSEMTHYKEGQIGTGGFCSEPIEL